MLSPDGVIMAQTAPPRMTEIVRTYWRSFVGEGGADLNDDGPIVNARPSSYTGMTGLDLVDLAPTARKALRRVVGLPGRVGVFRCAGHECKASPRMGGAFWLGEGTMRGAY